MMRPKKYFSHLNTKEKTKFWTVFISVALVNITAVVNLISYFFGDAENLYVIWVAVLIMLSTLTYKSIIERYGILKDIRDGEKECKYNIEFSTRKELDKKYPLDERMKNASEIYVMAMNGTSLLTGTIRNNIVDAMKSDKKFFFVSTDPESETCKEQMKNKIVGKIGQRPMEEALKNIDSILESYPNYADNIKCYITDVNIPYSLMIFKEKTDGTDRINFVRVDLLSIGIENLKRPSFVVPEEDEDMQKFFFDQWEAVKSKSKPYYPKEKKLCQE